MNFLNAGVLFAVLHSSETALSMKSGVDLFELVLGTEIFGLDNQHALNFILSHVNFSPLEKLGGKSLLELADFMYHNLYE